MSALAGSKRWCPCVTEPKVSEKKKIAEKIKEKEKLQKKKQEELKKRVTPVSFWVTDVEDRFSLILLRLNKPCKAPHCDKPNLSLALNNMGGGHRL